MFSVALQLMRWPVLLTAGICLGAALLWRGAPLFFTMLRRARWLLMSMLLIYAYATPGEYLSGFPDALAPTYEGLSSGLAQALRLAAVLAALALLLVTSSREDFMAGVYQLMQPLRLLQVSPERFSARLWLTLHYVECMPPHAIHDLRQSGWSLESLPQADAGPASIQIRCTRLSAWDAVALLLPLMFWGLA